MIASFPDRIISSEAVGRYGELTAQQARKEAQIFLGQIACGIDPLAVKRAEKVGEAP